MPGTRPVIQRETCVVVLVTKSCPTLLQARGCSPPGSTVHAISQARYWSGLPFPSPGDLLDRGINPRLLRWHVDSLPLSHMRSPRERSTQ